MSAFFTILSVKPNATKNISSGENNNSQKVILSKMTLITKIILLDDKHGIFII